MTVTMDRAGRLVIPKALRKEAGLLPGAPMRIRVRDGRIEIDPPVVRFRTVEKMGFLVAEALDPIPPLTAEEVRRTLRDLREGRIK